MTPSGRHLQPDHSRGDPNTIGGYILVHDRPAAFEGPDGMSYSVELAADETGDPSAPWAGYLLFLRWRRVGEQGVEGHLESDYVSTGMSEEDAKQRAGAMSLGTVRQLLNDLVTARVAQDRQPQRRWWDVMREEGE